MTNTTEATPITIAVIAGTKRAQRESIHAAKLIAEHGRTLPNVEIIFVDPNDFELPGDGNDPEGQDARFSAITAKADGFFVVSPEYNHSFPGSLKRLLDSELANYFHKPVAFAGASNGNWGGVRAVEALVGSVREMGLIATSYDVYFPYVQNMFDEHGALKDEYQQRYARSIGQAYAELVWFARIFKAARAERAIAA